MNSEQEMIQSAYQDAIKRLYLNLVDQYTEAGADDEKQREAEEHFSNGLTIARETRIVAIALLA